jgi:anti-sigma factor RsiW
MAAMTCRDARPRLSRYADAELPEREAQEIRSHLLDCPRCRSVVSSVLSVKRFFEDPDVPTMRAPAGFAERVTALAAAGRADEAEPARRFTRGLAALAASVALVAGGAVLERGGLFEGTPETLEAEEWDANRLEMRRRLDPSARLLPPAAPEEEEPPAHSPAPR